MQAKTTPLSTEKGAMVLTSVVLLLTMATLVTLYTGQIKSFENQITLNAQNRLLAFNSAEAGLMQALGILTIEPYWDGTQLTENLPGQGSFTTAGSWEDIVRVSATQRLVTLESVGQSPDRLSTVTITEQALIYPIVANLPDAPLVVAGGIAAGGHFEVVANPDGGERGCPCLSGVIRMWICLTVVESPVTNSPLQTVTAVVSRILRPVLRGRIFWMTMSTFLTM